MKFEQLVLFDFCKMNEIENELRKLIMEYNVLKKLMWLNREEMKLLTNKSRQILKERGIICP